MQSMPTYIHMTVTNAAQNSLFESIFIENEAKEGKELRLDVSSGDHVLKVR